jgi:hypothetical protein
MTMPRGLVWMVAALVLLLVLPLVGCRSAYYGAWERLGWHKRDLLVDNVRTARDAQEQAKEQFTDALERFIAVTSFDGGDLQRRYNELSRALDRSRQRADAVRSRIAAVDQVATDLFREWEGELSDYQSDELRRASERQLRDTRQRYDGLIRSMRDAESKMDPVLSAFNDQVLFLKHNLNARAIAALQETATSIRGDVAALIREMEASIGEANAFIEAMAMP